MFDFCVVSCRVRSYFHFIFLSFLSLEFLLENEEFSPVSKAYLNEMLARHTRVSRLLTGSSSAAASEGGLWLKALKHDLSIPGLQELCELNVRGVCITA